MFLTISSKVGDANGYDAVSERKQAECLPAGCLALQVPKNVEESKERSIYWHKGTRSPTPLRHHLQINNTTSIELSLGLQVPR